MGGYCQNVAHTLNSVGKHGVSFAVDCRNGTENPFVNGTLQAKEQGMNLNSNNVVRVPDRTAFRTQDADGGTRETPQKPSAHLGGATQRKRILSCANPYDTQSERVYHGDGAWHSLSSNSGGAEQRRHPHKR